MILSATLLIPLPSRLTGAAWLGNCEWLSSRLSFQVSQRKEKKKKKTQQNQKKEKKKIQESSDKRNGLQRRTRDFATFWEVNREKKKKLVTQAAAL